MGGYFFHDLVSAIIGLIKFEVTPLPSNEYTYALKMHDIIERHHPHDIYDIDTFKGRVNLFINSNDIKMIYYARALKEMKIASKILFYGIIVFIVLMFLLMMY